MVSDKLDANVGEGRGERKGGHEEERRGSGSLVGVSNWGLDGG